MNPGEYLVVGGDVLDKIAFCKQDNHCICVEIGMLDLVVILIELNRTELPVWNRIANTLEIRIADALEPNCQLNNDPKIELGL